MAAVVIFAVSLVGSLAARCCLDQHHGRDLHGVGSGRRGGWLSVPVANCFGGGVFLAAGFVHLLADAVADGGDDGCSGSDFVSGGGSLTPVLADQDLMMTMAVVAATATTTTSMLASMDIPCLEAHLQALQQQQGDSGNGAAALAAGADDACSLSQALRLLQRIQAGHTKADQQQPESSSRTTTAQTKTRKHAGKVDMEGEQDVVELDKDEDEVEDKDDEPYPWLFFLASLGALATLCAEHVVQTLVAVFAFAKQRRTGRPGVQWTSVRRHDDDDDDEDCGHGAQQQEEEEEAVDEHQIVAVEASSDNAAVLPVVVQHRHSGVGGLGGGRGHSSSPVLVRSHGHSHSHGIEAIAASLLGGSGGSESGSGSGAHRCAGSLVLIVALSVHSALAGLALGVEDDDDIWATFLAIVAHKGIEAFALASTLSRNRALSSTAYWVLTVGFSFVTPTAVMVGAALRGDSQSLGSSGSGADEEEPAWVASLVSVSAGMFVYIGYVLAHPLVG